MSEDKQTTSGFAIAALVLGILSVLGGLIFTGLPALILGYNGRSQVHRSNGEVGGLGMAWTGIIIGWLMVGLSIIVGVSLIGGLFFGVSRATSVLKVTGTNTAYNLKNSISAYFTEYRRFPISGTGTSGDARLKSDSSLMNILMASGPGSTGSNPRMIVFFAAKPARMSGAKKTGGVFTDPGGNVELFDPWGNLYQVIIDTDHDGKIDDPFTGAAVLESVLIWSSGSDGIDGTADDVKTW